MQLRNVLQNKQKNVWEDGPTQWTKSKHKQWNLSANTWRNGQDYAAEALTSHEEKEVAMMMAMTNKSMKQHSAIQSFFYKKKRKKETMLDSNSIVLKPLKLKTENHLKWPF